MGFVYQNIQPFTLNIGIAFYLILLDLHLCSSGDEINLNLSLSGVTVNGGITPDGNGFKNVFNIWYMVMFGNYDLVSPLLLNIHLKGRLNKIQILRISADNGVSI